MNIYLFKEVCVGANYGIGTYFRLLVKCLLTTSYCVTVVELRSEACRMGMKKSHRGQLRTICVPKSECKTDVNYYRNACLLLQSYINREERNLFHLNFMEEELLAKELRETYPSSIILLTIHYSTCKMYQKRILQLIASEKRLINKYCNQVIALSEHRCTQLMQEYGVKEQKIALIPCGIEPSGVTLDKDSCRRHFGFGKEQILLYVGRADSNKGMNIVTRMFNHLSQKVENIRLVMVGDERLGLALSNVTNNWGKITFMGHIPYKELEQLYTLADVAILPSYYEEQGYVPLEMLMWGIPIIANDTSGLHDMFGGGAAILMDLYSDRNATEELSDKVRQLLLSPALRAELSVNARNRYKDRYTYSMFSERMLELYKRAETT
jgi:glycosyltransferase involved in cell wall biosynthesis